MRLKLQTEFWKEVILMKEIKFIIVRNKAGHLVHLKSDWLHHETIARDNGYSAKEILESGIFLDSSMFIVECVNQRHIERKKDMYVGNCAYQDIRLNSWLKGRELESQLYFSKERVGLREGD